MLSTQKIFQVIFFTMIMVIFLIAFSQIFLSNYYNYGAESITFASMLRISSSEPYVSKITELPVLISSFSPILFGLFYPFIKFFSLTSIK